MATPTLTAAYTAEPVSFHTDLAYHAIRATDLLDPVRPELTLLEATVVLAIGYFQPVTRGELFKMFGREISRDLIAALVATGLCWRGPPVRRPAPYTYVTTPAFLAHFAPDRGSC